MGCSGRNPEWFKGLTKDVTFNYEVLPRIKIYKDCVFCQSVKKYIDKKRYDLFILAGYYIPTCIYAMN